MNAQELTEAGIKLFDENKWQTQMAKALGIDNSTLWRYLKKDSVPGPVAAAVKCWLERQEEAR